MSQLGGATGHLWVIFGAYYQSYVSLNSGPSPMAGLLAPNEPGFFAKKLGEKSTGRFIQLQVVHYFLPGEPAQDIALFAQSGFSNTLA